METTGPRAGHSHPLDPSALFTVGRGADNTIVVQHVQDSRHHVRIAHDGTGWTVEDLGTKNGTLRNRRLLVGAERLVEGDEFALPELVLTFRASDETMTVAIRAGGVSATTSFLFADLRDSTRFAGTHGDAAASEVIADYRRIVRAQIARAGGREMTTEGDGFFIVFDSAKRAVECAVAIQRAAAERTRDRPDRPIRVGIGIHAGEPVIQERNYVGLAVNIAARLAQNARAGEILLSDVMRALVKASDVPTMVKRDRISLKGIDEPPDIYAIGATMGGG